MNAKQISSAYKVYEDANAKKYDFFHTQKLFQDLQWGIQQDFKDRGTCEYMNGIFNGTIQQLRVVEHSVLYDMEEYYLHDRALTDPFKCNSIPHLTTGGLFHQQYYPWDEGLGLFSVTQDIKKIVEQIVNKQARLWREKQKEAAQWNGGVTTIPISEKPITNAQPSRDYCGETVHQSSNNAMDKAKEQANRIRSSAKDKADQIQAEARKEANRILGSAKDEASRIRNDADRILTEAQREAQTIRDEAAEAWAQILVQQRQLAQDRATLEDQSIQAEAEAKAKADQLIAQYLRDYQANLRNQWDQETRDELVKDVEAIRQLNDMKATLCDTTNDLKVTWRQNLENTIEGMKTILSDFESDLRSWQTSLYPRELRPIADCYVQLYRILTQDQLLTREITARAAEAEAGENTPIPLPSEGALHSNTMETLRQLNTSLQTFLKKFEKALNKLGLLVYTPEVGDPFDDVLHTSSDDEDDPYSMVVSRCFVPGIVRQSNGDLDDADPVIRAVVGLKKSEVN